jgi:hypothetical protein
MRQARFLPPGGPVCGGSEIRRTACAIPPSRHQAGPCDASGPAETVIAMNTHRIRKVVTDLVRTERYLRGRQNL